MPGAIDRPAVHDLDALQAHIVANRFIPVPPTEQRFVGDGDFRAIGAEFLGHFVRLGGLSRGDRVLDIGCGIGRMALPLTQYLDPARGRYEGVDVVASGVNWCRRAITPAYPNFRFHHLDVANPLYNPNGALDGGRVRLPYFDAAYDFVILTSVITHLRLRETRAYAAEIARLLKPGGRCFASLFLLTAAARAGLAAGRARPAFRLDDGDGPDHIADPAHPEAAVAYDETALLALFAAVGLRLTAAPAYGSWSGGEGDSFQDLCVFEKAA